MTQKIMIFGKPGAGKSTFARQLHKETQVPLYHLDTYFFDSHWIERSKEEFMASHHALVSQERWIIEGNALSSLETRWSKADLVLYFNFPTWVCLGRLLKRRFFSPEPIPQDRPGPNILRLRLLRYLWSFEDRVAAPLASLLKAYPQTPFREIKSERDVEKIKRRLGKQ